MPLPPNTTALDACVDTTAAHAELVRLGFDVVMRYGAAAPWKCIKQDEARSMAAHGLKLILLYESTAKDILLGAGEGARAGAHAASFAPTVGLRPGIGAAIYPTADFDLRPEEIDVALAYLRAFAAACPGFDLGFYANGIGNDAAFRAGVVKYRMITQSLGFAGSRESLAAGRFEIAQRLPARVAGISVDPNSLRSPGLDIGARVPFAPAPAAAPRGIVQDIERDVKRLI